MDARPDWAGPSGSGGGWGRRFYVFILPTGRKNRRGTKGVKIVCGGLILEFSASLLQVSLLFRTVAPLPDCGVRVSAASRCLFLSLLLLARLSPPLHPLRITSPRSRRAQRGAGDPSTVVSGCPLRVSQPGSGSGAAFSAVLRVNLHFGDVEGLFFLFLFFWPLPGLCVCDTAGSLNVTIQTLFFFLFFLKTHFSLRS